MESVVRSSSIITFSVWKALFLREAVHRLFGGRAAWVWLLLEPMTHVVFMMFIFGVISVRTIGGIETAVWLMVGLLGFFTFRRTATQCMNAVEANKALFTYRQVKPVDTVIVRAALEGLLMLVVAIILFAGAAFFGIANIPADPLAVLEAFFGLWAFGVGFGLMASVASEMVPELGKIIGLFMTPLYFVSGIMVPLNIVPPPYHEWLMLNPIAHGVEAARYGFASYYHAAPELSIPYLYTCALVLTFFGFALHARFASRLTTQ